MEENHVKIKLKWHKFPLDWDDQCSTNWITKGPDK